MRTALAARQGLSERQREILTLKANGLTCEEIRHCLKPKVSISTVHGALFRIYRKYGAENDVHAVAIAIATGDIGIDAITIPLPAEILRRGE